MKKFLFLLAMAVTVIGLSACEKQEPSAPQSESSQVGGGEIELPEDEF